MESRMEKTGVRFKKNKTNEYLQTPLNTIKIKIFHTLQGDKPAKK